jgi:dTDP-4-amino-4,6-dideoxygalactose transaminase
MKRFDNPIYVARPTLPPLAEYMRCLEEIWGRRWLTNRGPLLQRFEAQLAQVLQTENLSLFTNGSLALAIAVQGLALSGEVVTTPFSFVASANALMQRGITPVFADIERHGFTLDPDCVEAAITPRTTGILAVHLFGFPCALDKLAAISERHGLALIYDAAHAFGVTANSRAIARFGDVTMFSFHATKPFHSIEGGALTFMRPELKQVFEALCNHGLARDGDVPIAGTNAKMTEFQAAMGTLLLEHFAATIEHMGRIEAIYRSRLRALAGIELAPPLAAGVAPNHAYMPILVDETGFGMSRDQLQAALARFNVFAREYFHPLISDMRAYRHLRGGDPLERARYAARRVLALPTYADLPPSDVHRICDLIAAIQAAGPAATPTD